MFHSICYVILILFFFAFFGSITYLLTFHRKAGSVFCTAQGLTGAQVKTLTKHKQDVFDKDYLCELCIKVMTTIAGFLPNNDNDCYYVPRAMIGLPGDLEAGELAKLLFPNLTIWREEHQSANGDKSSSCSEFLYTVIVYFAEVICQDGVLWIHNHKNNPAVNELKRLLDGRTGAENYVSWTQRKLNEIKQSVKLLQTKKTEIKDLKAGLAEAIESTMSSKRLLASSIQETIKLNSFLKASLDRLTTVRT